MISFCQVPLSYWVKGGWCRVPGRQTTPLCFNQLKLAELLNNARRVQWLFCLENIVDTFWFIMLLFRSWNRRDQVEWSAKARKPLGSGLQGFRGNLIQSSDGPQKHLLEWYAKASKGSPWTLQQAIGNGCQYPLGITQWLWPTSSQLKISFTHFINSFLW